MLNGLVHVTYPLYASEQIQLREIHTSYNHVSLCWGNAVCQPIILFYLHGVHPCRFCLPRQVSHLQFPINGTRNIYCNCSKFREITPLSLPQTTTIIFPSVSCDCSSWKQSCIRDAAKGNG